MITDIRLANKFDLEEIVEIYNYSIPDKKATAELAPVKVEDRKEWFEKHESTRRPIWVIESKNKVLGWLSLQDFYPRCAWEITAELSIYIHPDFQNTGLGKQLLQHCFDNCKNLKIENLVALVFGHNDPSIRLFNNFGFHQWGLLPGVTNMDGVLRDIIILGKKIK